MKKCVHCMKRVSASMCWRSASDEGGPVPGLLATNGEPVLSWLDEQTLRQLAEVGGGVFRVADYRDSDSRAILKAVLSHATRQAEYQGANPGVERILLLAADTGHADAVVSVPSRWQAL